MFGFRISYVKLSDRFVNRSLRLPLISNVAITSQLGSTMLPIIITDMDSLFYTLILNTPYTRDNND